MEREEEADQEESSLTHPSKVVVSRDETANNLNFQRNDMITKTDENQRLESLNEA